MNGKRLVAFRLHACGQQLLALCDVVSQSYVLVPELEDDAMTLVLRALESNIGPCPVWAVESGLLYIQLQLYKYWLVFM